MMLSFNTRAARGGFLLAVAWLWALLPEGRAAAPTAREGAATESRAATRAALDVLRTGGNAVDAAVAAAFVAGVVSPSSSGLGGGGFALVRRAADTQPFVLDFRESAPAALDAAAFEARPFADNERARATGVPGELSGLAELHQRFGKRKWAELVRPAAQWAESGFLVEGHLASVLASPPSQLLRSDSGLADLYFKAGKPAVVGARLRNPKLAKSLRRIANEGARSLYEGPLGGGLVAAARAKGGALDLADLKAYRPKERVPLRVSWEGYEVYSMPPPSAGGLLLAQVLGLFSSAELKKLGLGSGAYQHILAEAMRGSLSDRMRYVGDPEFATVNVEALLQPARLSARKRAMAYDRTHTPPRFGLEQGGTHHLVVADREGNVVSLSTTINSAFGAKLSGAESGIVLNDQLTDFTAKKDVLPFGLDESPNRARPGARPVSSMTPTIVTRAGRPVLVLGGSGGTTIPLNVTQVLLARLVFDLGAQEALKAPRFFVPTSGATLRVDSGTAQALLDDLRWRGEIVEHKRSDATAVQLIAFGADGQIESAADPRKLGSGETR